MLVRQVRIRDGQTCETMRKQKDGETVTSPLVRTTRLASAYRRYLDSADSPSFAADVDEHYCGSTLTSLLRRGDVELRRAAALSLGTLGDHSAIEPLGRALSDSDRGVRLAADDSFRALLVRDAAPLHHQQLLKVMHLNDGGEHAGALAPTMILVDQAPLYAEAHHQLAICWHGLENFYQAEAAYSACLWHCRYHYPAWQGLARCRLMLGDGEAAISALRRGLEICPDLENARAQIRIIERKLRQANDS
ncbi:Tetratricopeptide repeat protein [Rubripirellula tenax]|uniref:Tetratricopeptide repeat protein n=2 Tax=Rubripirellula tenax TaxID=2528015 RepID=A0A5C6FDZ1_9BACT|nr:Tetratricopeptide repeat protein [Rubripirellula tenax]